MEIQLKTRYKLSILYTVVCKVKIIGLDFIKCSPYFKTNIWAYFLRRLCIPQTFYRSVHFNDTCFFKLNEKICKMTLCYVLSLQRHYSPGWASASFKSFFHPSRFRATIVQFLHPSFAASSFTPSSQHSLGLPLGCFPPGSLRRTLLDKSMSSWHMTCPVPLSLLSLQNFTMSFSPHNGSSWLVLIRHLTPSITGP